MDSKIIGVNLRRIRESKGFSQLQVAECAGISRVAYRNIESGKSAPKVSTLQNIVSSLDVKLQDVLVPIRTLENVRFRSLKKMTSRDSILNEVARWLDDFNYLESLLGRNENYKFKDFVSELSTMNEGNSRAMYAAGKAREILELDDEEPIRDVAGLLESSGIKLYPLSLASDGFFGLSVAEEDGGPAIVVNVWERISVERWIFSAAHELGHLLLHLDAYNVKESEEDKVQEDEANTFASFFLMPEKVFTTEWKDTNGLSLVDRVLKVKQIFQVSYKTVLYRLSEIQGNYVWGKFQAAYKARTGRTLGLTDEPKALSPDKFQQSEVLRSKEPESLSTSCFIEDHLSRLVREAIEKDEITMSRGAEILRLDFQAMRERINSWV